MRKTLFTLDISYPRAVTDQTYPWLRRYAQKIGADFHIINQRMFPSHDMEYEKLQIHELGRDNDWNIYIDADALVHPDFFDMTTYLSKDTVMHYGVDSSDLRWTSDKYFMRDGRRISSCNWFTVGSNWCLDLWQRPDDLNEDEIVRRICPSNFERVHGVSARHLVSDYILSRNIARFGLKVTTMTDLIKKLGRENSGYIWHAYTIPLQAKITALENVIKQWQLNTPVGEWVEQGKIQVLPANAKLGNDQRPDGLKG